MIYLKWIGIICGTSFMLLWILLYLERRWLSPFDKEEE
jgi:hypothetical protein